ncbi:hypothetical protein HNV08_06025 [Winogradskyella eckloniae]|uniref:hypothetical protein n=1 Tax=Winogradskyella eckloniae TaxID=1089306 RepID=UPI0015674F25|nr:hypothetical protein [Winogradskyella eckloniae]NRD19597.1 hypothetical protein [Winogradskyella eckloniae]
MAFYYNNKSLSIVLLSFLLLLNCKNEQKVAEPTTKIVVEYDMYQPSEMANLMNAMYAYNQQLKAQIVAGETPTHLPLDLAKLHSAEMTDKKGRTAAWNSFVNVFIESQHTIIDTISNVDLKERYNASINNCLGCHKTECTGPIPKIKKLLIQ